MLYSYKLFGHWDIILKSSQRWRFIQDSPSAHPRGAGKILIASVSPRRTGPNIFQPNKGKQQSANITKISKKLLKSKTFVYSDLIWLRSHILWPSGPDLQPSTKFFVRFQNFSLSVYLRREVLKKSWRGSKLQSSKHNSVCCRLKGVRPSRGTHQLTLSWCQLLLGL